MGSGGTATGLEQAGFTAAALVEIDAKCCGTLRANWPDWQVFEGSIERIDGTKVAGQVDLLSAGPPCPTAPPSWCLRSAWSASTACPWSSALARPTTA